VGSTFSASDATCSFTTQLQVYNEATNVWDVHSTPASPYSAYTASFVNAETAWSFAVPAADGPTLDPIGGDTTVIRMRYVIGDQNSLSASATLYDEFSLTMNFECTQDSVTVATVDDIGTITYVINAADSVTAGSVTHLKAAC
jgi:hypothetical protein